jgi:hypothetical protein
MPERADAQYTVFTVRVSDRRLPFIFDERSGRSSRLSGNQRKSLLRAGTRGLSTIEQFTETLGKGREPDGFLQEGMAGVQDLPVRKQIVRITRHENDLDVWMMVSDFVSEFAPAHLWHDHISKHQVDRTGI